jgi:hypothetical protein
VSGDIWMVPWNCGDPDCPVGWHFAQYTYDDETGEPLRAKYGPGDPDWDPIEASEIPTVEQEQAAWKAYYRHIARTGEDPCGELVIATQTTRWSYFLVRFASWVGQSLHGVLFVGGRPTSHDARSRRFRPAAELPEELRQFLALEPHGEQWTCTDAPSLIELQAQAEKSEHCWRPHRLRQTGFLQFEVKVELAVPRPVTVVRQERRAQARAWLAKEKTRTKPPCRNASAATT